MTASRRLSLIDLWWICLASALFRHEHVLLWFLPDDDLYDDIALPDIHVTHRTLCGDLTGTHIPTRHHSYGLASLHLLHFPLVYPLIPHHFTLIAPSNQPTLPHRRTHHFDHGRRFTPPESAPSYVIKLMYAFITHSVRVLYATYCSASVSERKRVPLTASKVPLITHAATRQARPVDGTVCL